MYLYHFFLFIGPNEGDCKSFYISGEQVGIIRSDIWKHLQHYPSVFQYDKGSQSVTLNPDWRTYEERSEKLDTILRELKTKRIFSTLDGWRDEVFFLILFKHFSLIMLAAGFKK